MQLDACGAIERKDDRHWLIAGENQFLLEHAGAAIVGPPVCVLGALDARSVPYRLRAASVEPVTN